MATVADDVARTRPSLEPMLEARSVAIVGASVKEGSLGRAMLEELQRGGYEGDVWPVNPGYDEVLGLACYPSIEDAPGPPDLAILGVANHRVEQAARDAVAAQATWEGASEVGRNRLLVGIGIALLVLLAIGVIASALLGRRARSRQRAGAEPGIPAAD